MLIFLEFDESKTQAQSPKNVDLPRDEGRFVLVIVEVAPCLGDIAYLSFSERQLLGVSGGLS